MFLKTLHIACVALAFLAFIPSLKAQESATDDTDIIGTILEVEGEATVAQAGKEPRAATVNTPVRTGDTLATGPASRLYVMLLDQTELTLSENGQMVLDDFFFDNTDRSENSAAYSVIKGAFLYVSGLVAKKENPDVTVKIPSGSIGIRGTRFWGGELDGEYGVLVGDGEVEINTGAAGGTILRKGQGVTLRGPGVVPDPVKIWEKQKIERAVQTVALKRPEVVGKRIEIEKAERQQYLLDRHKIHQQRALEKIRKEVEATNPEMKGKLTRAELLKIRKERGQTAPAPANELQKQRKESDVKRDKLRSKAEEKRQTLREKAELSREKIRDRAETIRDDIRTNAEMTRQETTTSVTAPVTETVKDTTIQTVEPVQDIKKLDPVKIQNTLEPVIKKTEPIVKPIIEQPQ